MSNNKKKGFTFNPKLNEDEAILKWLNMQTNLSDAIRFLIEKDIMQSNGIRVVHATVPTDREFVAPVNNNIYELNTVQPTYSVQPVIPTSGEIKREPVIRKSLVRKEKAIVEDITPSKEESNEDKITSDIPDCWL